MVRAAVARAILERHVPRADDLPIDEILEIRRKYRSELEAFRSGLATVASQVNLSDPPLDIEAIVHDAVAAKVDPAVSDLKAALYSARLDALKKIGQSWESLAKATVPYLVSIAAGAPTYVQELMAAAGILTSLGGPLLEAEIEKRKAMYASQWSILFRLEKHTKKLSSLP